MVVERVEHVGAHVRPQHLRRDRTVVGHADRLADVVAQRRDHHLGVRAGPLGQGGRLQAVGELVGGEAVGDLTERPQQHQDPVGHSALVLRGLLADHGPLLGGGFVHTSEGRVKVVEVRVEVAAMPSL